MSDGFEFLAGGGRSIDKCFIFISGAPSGPINFSALLRVRLCVRGWGEKIHKKISLSTCHSSFNVTVHICRGKQVRNQNVPRHLSDTQFHLNSIIGEMRLSIVESDLFAELQ